MHSFPRDAEALAAACPAELLEQILAMKIADSRSPGETVPKGSTEYVHEQCRSREMQAEKATRTMLAT